MLKTDSDLYNHEHNVINWKTSYILTNCKQ